MFQFKRWFSRSFICLLLVTAFASSCSDGEEGAPGPTGDTGPQGPVGELGIKGPPGQKGLEEPAKRGSISGSIITTDNDGAVFERTFTYDVVYYEREVVPQYSGWFSFYRSEDKGSFPGLYLELNKYVNGEDEPEYALSYWNFAFQEELSPTTIFRYQAYYWPWWGEPSTPLTSISNFNFDKAKGKLTFDFYFEGTPLSSTFGTPILIQGTFDSGDNAMVELNTQNLD